MLYVSPGTAVRSSCVTRMFEKIGEGGCGVLPGTCSLRPRGSVLALGAFCAAIGACSTRGAANGVTNVTRNTPYGVAIGPDGTLYFADSSNCRIRLEA